MARKKQKIAGRSTAAVDVVNPAGVEINIDSFLSSVKAECERIVEASRHGNCIKALNLMKDLCSKYENSPHADFINGVQGIVFVNVASRTNDSEDKQRYYKGAVESARRAVSLSPNSIELAHFYAYLLYEVAKEDKDYEEVVQECERALAIENAVDHLKDSLQDQYSEKYPTAQSHVLYIKSELCSLIQKANIALISTWMKDLANEEEKFEFMPVRRIIQGKKLEDQKKEIEAKVAAARILQHNHLGNGVNNSSHISRGLGSGRLERKHGKVQLTVSSDERRERVQLYWNSMSLDRKKDFLKVKIADLQEHITALNDRLPSKVILESLSFCKKENRWHILFCCLCNKRISEIEAFRKHIEIVHLGIMPLNLRSVLPKPADFEWVEMIRDRSWEPLDLDTIDKESLLSEKWSLSHDPQRTKLLKELRAVLQNLVELQCLTETHVESLSYSAVSQLQKHLPGSELFELNVHQKYSCICFLGAKDLRNILSYLCKISDSCERNIGSGESTGTDYSAPDPFMEKTTFGQDDSVVVSVDNGSVDDNSPETDAVLFSMYEVSLSPEELASCTQFDYMIEEKAQEGLQTLQLFEKEHNHLKVLCEEKCVRIGYDRALAALRKRLFETGSECRTQDYETVLKNRKEELIKTGTTMFNNQNELSAITDVLKETKSLRSGEVDQSHMIKIIENLVTSNFFEFNKLEARMKSIHAKRKHLFQEHAYASTHDFRLILIPLLKFFLRARLEDLSEKAIMAELTLDSKSSVVGSGVYNLKLMGERKKGRKKNKKSRKNSGPKVTNSDNLLDKTAEEILLPDDHDEECPNTEIAASRNNDDAAPDTDYRDLQLQEEELKRKLELEADERKLEGALAYQRQKEYEAKQKSLANKHEVSSTAIRQEEIEIASEGEQLEETLEDQQHTLDGAIQKHPVEQHREKNEEFHTISGGAADNTTKGCTLSIGSVNTGVILTDNERQPVSEKEPSHGSEPTIGHDSPIDRSMPHKKLQETSDPIMSRDEVITDVNVMDAHGTGLNYEVDEYICFLNVMIQSLWHIKRFRDELSPRTPEHVHDGACIICALCDIFNFMSTPSTNNGRKLVALARLGDALSKLAGGRNFFQEDKTNDASKVLEIILTCLHQSFTPSPAVSLKESVDINRKETWDCTNISCLAHSTFGTNIIERMICTYCGLWSRYRKYTSFFCRINANDLREMKITCQKFSFDSLLNLVETCRILVCDPKDKGCGMLNIIQDIVTTSPHVFTTVLIWKNICESVEDITGTLAALSTIIDMTLLYPSLNTLNFHCLVSMVCYYGSQYCCLANSLNNGQWIKYNDFETGKVIGDWNDVVKMCKTERIRPHVLLFEAVDSDANFELEYCEALPTRNPAKDLSLIKDLCPKQGLVIEANFNCRGLENKPNENNCFLNCVIQCLWNLKRLRDELTRVFGKHYHVGSPCVICSLYDIFKSLSEESTNDRRDVVDPTSLRDGLSNLHSGSNLFQKGEQDDASELFLAILDCFHRSCTQSPVASNAKFNSCTGDCVNDSCLVYSVFGMDMVDTIICGICGLESILLNYRSLIHNTNAESLRRMKAKNRTESFGELLKLVDKETKKPCDSCRHDCNVLRSLVSSAKVFTVVLVWKSCSESVEDIGATLAALSTDVDISCVYTVDAPQVERLHLSSMVCLYEKHYTCFGYSRDHEKWILYDDATVNVIGSWENVVTNCIGGRKQPTVLFFEAVVESVADTR